MEESLLRLFPQPSAELPLRGLYLEHRLHTLGDAAKPLVYANFLSSLDGRIALGEPTGDQYYLPKRLTTRADFRLFLELHAQADCLITHGGYLRALAQQKLGNILQVGSAAEHGDLADWRRQQALPPQPAVVIASASLDFPFVEAFRAAGQPFYIATGQAADPQRMRAWQAKGFEIFIAGHQRWVEGGALIDLLAERGFRSIYLIAGPRMLETMLRTRRLSRFYQTTSHQLLGGERFASLIQGKELGRVGRMHLRSLYYYRSLTENDQCFAQFAPDNALYK